MSPKTNSQQPWFTRTREAALAALSSSEAGLADRDVKYRRERYGYNSLPLTTSQSWLRRLLNQFANILILVLLVAGIGTWLMGHRLDAAVIFGVVIINAVIGYLQEGKAEQSIAAVRKLVPAMAMALRNGQWISISAAELVPGDIVSLQSGDKVPADLRLLSARELMVNESMLTGESLPVAKQTEALDEQNVALGEQSCMAFSGTFISAGHGTGVVVATGEQTEIGKINRLLRQVDSLQTPLLRQINRFALWLTAVILGVAALTFVYGLVVWDNSVEEMLLAAVGIAVAAIPEGLPAIITITLAIGVQRMARRHAIIRRLPAVETLGAVSVICSDKTGTLTCNEMTVESLVTAAGTYQLTGAGYDPQGQVLTASGQVADPGLQLLQLVGRVAVLCNTAQLTHSDTEGWQVHGDPTEGALLTLGAKLGLTQAALQASEPRTDMIPFESEHRFMATLHHDQQGAGLVLLKGAPEAVLRRCDRQLGAKGEMPLDKDWWLAQGDLVARQGLRLLALAYRPAGADERALTMADVEQGLVMLGLVGMMDPPRPEAQEAIRHCYEAGIQVKMITGDHAMTASAIAEKIGIQQCERVLTGVQLDELDDTQLAAEVLRTNIYARTSPEHKLRLVQALQGHGKVVAMTGDGVNDAPALHQADVGVAMGRKGTEAAKEAAQMVLADDRFSSIAHAVQEGRVVFDNIRKAFLFTLATGVGEATVILLAILLGWELPVTPVQILWVNMVTVVTLSMALVFEPAESNVMVRPPRPTGEPLLPPFLIGRLILVAAIQVAGTFGLFAWHMGQGVILEEARTVALNTVVFFEIFYVFSARGLYTSAWRQGLFTSSAALYACGLLVLLQMAITYWSPMQMLFGTAPLGLDSWLMILPVTFSLLIIGEFEKWLQRRSRAGQLRAAQV